MTFLLLGEGQPKQSIEALWLSLIQHAGRQGLAIAICRQANTEADALANQLFAVHKSTMHTHTHLHTHIKSGISTCNAQKRMWQCESIMLCCHRVTCEPWQGADGPRVPCFLLAMPFSLSKHTRTCTQAQFIHAHQCCAHWDFPVQLATALVTYKQYSIIGTSLKSCPHCPLQ